MKTTDLLFIGYMFIFVCVLAYQIYKNKGFIGAIFGAPILRTVGEVKGAKRRMMNLVIKVHKLDSDSPDKVVGVELLAKSFMAFQMQGIALSVEETRNLIKHLETAIKGKP